MNKKETIINLLAAATAFSVNIIINFFLSPYIISHVGIEAYGFFSLANNFVMYISLLTLAINSMASRFITISTHKNNLKLANQYYSSVFISNLIMSLGIFIIALPIIYNMEYFLQIPYYIDLDVKLLFICVIFNFLIDGLLSIFSVSYIIKNQLYLSSIVQIKSNCIRLCIILGLFYFFLAHVFYLGVGIIISTIFMRTYDLYYKNKLIPYLQINRMYFNWISLKEIISSGIWNTVTRLGNILSGNLDLLIVNLFLSASDMGMLAVTKIAPNLLTSITGIFANVFMPSFLELYAKDKYREMIEEIKKALKIFSLLLSMPLVILLAYGEEFFKLWLPEQNASMLYILSVLSLVAIVVIGPVAVMHNIFTIVNKIKINSLLIVFTGFLNTLGGLLILTYTDWGLIGIVSLTYGLSLVRNLFYTVPYGAVYLKCKWNMFFPILFKSFISIIFVSAVGVLIKSFMDINTWLMFIFLSILILVLDIFIQMMFIFSKQDRYYLYNQINSKFNK